MIDNDIETLREFINAYLPHIDGERDKALGALDRLEAGQAIEGYRQFCAMRRRAEKAESERDALRAKLEKAKEALTPFSEAAAQLDDDFRDVSDLWEHSSAMSITGGDIRRARAVLAELCSDDAPAQPPQISDEAIYAAQVAYETALRNGVRNAFDRMHAAIAAALEVMEKG